MFKLPIFFTVIITIFVIILQLQPVKREIAYKLGISGDPTTSCCKADNLSDGKFDENATSAIFDNQIINYPKTSLRLAQFQSDFKVLGTTTPEGVEKWIEVSLSEQKLRAWEGNKLVMEFPISSGKWAPTPIGTFNIWYKVKNQKMEGGSKELGTYYNLPNVPNNLFFYQGYALHGAYWHNNFGAPMSHGCVNEPLANAAAIFDWAGPILPQGVGAIKATPENPGTRVLIH